MSRDHYFGKTQGELMLEAAIRAQRWHAIRQLIYLVLAITATGCLLVLVLR
jgi:hypothetical protein